MATTDPKIETFFCPRLLSLNSNALTLIHVEHGTVKSVEPAADVPSGATVLEGTVAPGLVDLQVNGWGARDVLEGTVEAIEAIGKSLLAAGVTAWLPTIVSCAEDKRLATLDAIAAALARGDDVGARILGVHLEGPWISEIRKGAHDPSALEAPSERLLAQSLDRHPGLVRIVTLAPELAGGLDAIAQIVASGSVASIGHTDASLREASAAIDAGATMATHLFNAMRPMHHRDTGVIGAVLTDDRIVAGLIADGIHVDPSVVSLVFRAKPGRVSLVSDVVGGKEFVVTDRAAHLADGTLAGAVAGLGDGVATAVEVGVSMEDAVHAATRIPADVIGASVGRLEAGTPADFVVLDDDVRPRATYLAGERVWSN